MFHTQKKQLILVRHAKALELQEFDGIDFDRPLTIRGEGSIRIMARYLRLIGVRPDKIMASPSGRTRETAHIIASQFAEMPVEYRTDLYNGNTASSKRDANQVHLDVVTHMKGDVHTLMIVGHNDDLTEFSQFLS